MGFRAIGKRLAKSGMRSAEGLEHFLQPWPEQMKINAKSDYYLHEYNYLRPKLKNVKKKLKEDQ